MNSVRSRLIILFVVATVTPLAATLWITTSLLERSLSLSSTRELDEVSRSLEQTGRSLYARTREALRAAAASGEPTHQIFTQAGAATWPPEARDFSESGDKERFVLAGEVHDRMEYYVRRGEDIVVYSRPIGVSMRRLTEQHARARALVQRASGRDLRRGFMITFIVLVVSVWLLSLAGLILLASRISKPIQQLTAGLAQLASGDLTPRLQPRGHDEVSEAMTAFNDTAEKLQASRDRLVTVTRLASWQTLARKMAHEVKNSLTPIRLTMEELIARRDEDPKRFIEQAAQMVVDEVATLERRVRAFTEFAAEPPIQLAPVDVNGILQERLALLRTAHPAVVYESQFGLQSQAIADEDLLKGILTNLLENAAYAAGGGGVVLVKTALLEDKPSVEVHDSGAGLSTQARLTLFEPTISFKKAGMGLGLSIARKSALLLGGDITLVKGDLGGAAFRVVLRPYNDSWRNESSSSMTRRTSAVRSA